MSRLAARNSHLMISLADHAERVSKRRMSNPLEAATPSAADRMAALRRRILGRAAEAQGAASQGVGAGQGGEDRRGGGAETRVDSCHDEAGRDATESSAASTPSKEDVKIHQTSGTAGEALDCGARGRAASANADTAAAACFVAWHDGDRGGPEGGPP